MSYRRRPRYRSSFTTVTAPPQPPAAALRESTLITSTHTTLVRPFESLPDLARYAEKVDAYYGGNGGTSWTGQTREEAFRHAKQGDDSRVGAALRLLDDVDARIESTRRVYAPAPAGAYYVLPDVLAGVPAPMRRKQPRPGLGPLRIYVDLVSSAGISHSVLSRRGNACLALASKLAAVRPVELYGVAVMGIGRSEDETAALTVAVTSSPLNLSLASAALSSVGIVRGIGYGVLWQYGCRGLWGWGGAPTYDNSRARYVRLARETLELSGQDLYIPPPYLDDDIARDPIAWIASNINRLQQPEED